MSNVHVNLNGLDYTFPRRRIDELYDWVESNGGEPLPIEQIKPEYDHDDHIIDIVKTLPDEATIGELLDLLVKRENKKVEAMNTNKPANKPESNNLPTRYESGSEL